MIVESYRIRCLKNTLFFRAQMEKKWLNFHRNILAVNGRKRKEESLVGQIPMPISVRAFRCFYSLACFFSSPLFHGFLPLH